MCSLYQAWICFHLRQYVNMFLTVSSLEIHRWVQYNLLQRLDIIRCQKKWVILFIFENLSMITFCVVLQGYVFGVLAFTLAVLTVGQSQCLQFYIFTYFCIS